MSETTLTPAMNAVREQIVIAPHHPDRLRRPPVRPGAVGDDRFSQTLLWNIFRTFELLPPAFWLRRLYARLHVGWLPAAPETVRVDLWRALTPPPIQRLDGAKPRVMADAIIETEHAVCTLMLDGDRDADAAATLIAATSWHAGTRDCSFGVVSRPSPYHDAGVTVVERYFRSKESLRLRSGSRGHLLSNVRGVGSLHWTDLAAILRECEQADVLARIERELARNVVAWLERVGVS
jgi:hypothetical protein